METEIKIFVQNFKQEVSIMSEVRILSWEVKIWNLKPEKGWNSLFQGLFESEKMSISDIGYAVATPDCVGGKSVRSSLILSST